MLRVTFMGGWISALALAPCPAEAGPRDRSQAAGAVVEGGAAGATIDWTRGLIVASGAAPGDIRAPSPEVARVAARRRALAQARGRLAEAAGAVVVGARSVTAWAEAEPGVAQALGEAVERALVLEVEYGSDGSVVVQTGLPLEAVRQAVQGPARLALTGEGGAGEPSDRAPTAIVVDARAVLDRPALGLSLVADQVVYTGPVVFYRRPARARADARRGPRVVRTKATSVGDGELAVALSGQALAVAKAAQVLVIVVIGTP
ncbi:hypothetical protein [Haliangium sp.]|uniref:hypothetical protein n=1 Tax=Haliangium sp. TaxID=2663208 RepID=UPI003D13264E